MNWIDYTKPAGLGDPYYTGLGETSESDTATWVGGKVSHRDEYVQKFIGHIKDFDIVYSRDGDDSINVYCEDFGSFLKESFNLFSPTPMDYFQAGYMEEQGAGNNKSVEGQNKPKSFDGWEVHKAMEILMTESFVDPYLFYNKKKLSNRHNSPVDGDYLLKGINWSQDDIAKFDTKPYYGFPSIVMGDGDTDDEYITAVSMGKYYLDAIKELAKPYYMDFYFNNHGQPVLNAYNTPDDIKKEPDFTYTGDWDTTQGIKHMGVKYFYTAVVATASIDFSGTSIDVIVGMGPNSGVVNAAVNEYGVKFTILHENVALLTVEADLYNSTAWAYLDGIDPNLGYNPSIIRVGKFLPYDDYKLLIEANYNADTYNVQVDGIFTYNEDLEDAIKVIDSGDTYNRGGVKTLTVNDSIKDVRNEVYVYGSLKGPVMGTNEDGTRGLVNPHNPINQYNYSIARDLNSVYSTSASNFTGRPLRVLIQDPKIYNEEQADLISYNVLQTYRESRVSPQFSIIPNPMIQPNDCLSVVDSYKDYINTANPIWIKSISSKMSQDNSGVSYDMETDCTPIKPPTGYFPKPSFADGVVGNIRNIKLNNSGTIMLLKSGVSNSATDLELDTSFYDDSGIDMLSRIPTQGYLRVSDENDNDRSIKLNSEVIYYEHTAAASVKLWSLNRGLQGTHSTAFDATTPVNLGYDAYTGETMGIFPTIELDCLKPGKLQVQVWTKMKFDKYLVSTLTGDDDKNYPFSGFQNIQKGHYKFIWDGVDQIGAYNNFATDGEVVNGGFYVNNDRTLSTEAQNLPTSVKLPEKSYGKFYYVIDFESNDGETYHTSGIGTRELRSGSGYFITKLGPRGMSLFALGGKDKPTYYYSDNETANTDNRIGFGDLYTRLHPTYRGREDRSSSWKAPVYFKNEGIDWEFMDVSWDLESLNSSAMPITLGYTQSDPYAARQYKANINYHILTYVMTQWQENDGGHKIWKSFNTKGKLIEDDAFRNYYPQSKSGLFNPKNAISSDNKLVNFIPLEVRQFWQSLYDNGRADADSLYAYINNAVFFSGGVWDRSGRQAWNRTYGDCSKKYNGGLYEHVEGEWKLPLYKNKWLLLTDGGWSAFNKIKDTNNYLDEKWLRQSNNNEIRIAYWKSSVYKEVPKSIYNDPLKDEGRRFQIIGVGGNTPIDGKMEHKLKAEMVFIQNHVFWRDEDYTNNYINLSELCGGGNEQHYENMQHGLGQIGKDIAEEWALGPYYGWGNQEYPINQYISDFGLNNYAVNPARGIGINSRFAYKWPLPCSWWVYTATDIANYTGVK